LGRKRKENSDFISRKTCAIMLKNKMKINFYIKTYKDKILLLPREEVAWERTNKIFKIKLGWLLWDLRLSFNF
jgi:hypothetical protein